MNYPTPPVFAGFVLAKWTNDGYKPGTCIRINPAHVAAYAPARNGSGDETPDATEIYMTGGRFVTVLLSYDQVGRRLADAYECPGE